MKSIKQKLRLQADKGKCRICDKETSDKHKFCDDSDDGIGYWEWCCDGCYDGILEDL